MDWEKKYEERTEHTKLEAENVELDKNEKIIQIKKNIQNVNNNVGEFLGINKIFK